MVDSKVFSKSEVDASLVVAIASIVVIELVDVNVVTAEVALVSRVDSVVVRKAEVDASLVVVIASVEVNEELDSNVARGVVVVVP